VLERITLDDAELLLQLPRTLGIDPADGEPIVANNGRYGPYIVKGKDFRSLDNEDRLLSVTLDEALRLLAEPKVYRRGGQNMAAKGPLREFGTDPVSERPVVAKDGKFGVYVTDGETNASIGKGDRIEEMLPERAFELLAIRRDTTGGNGTKKPAAKRPAARKSPAKKGPARKR
jgi:DNA topoisomerase-1